MFRFPGRSSGGGSSSAGKREQKKKCQVQGESTDGETVVKNKKKGDNADLPDKMKKLRACMICSLIKTETQFEEDGCDNCESFLHFAGTAGSVPGYTSANFEGMIAMISPEDSWVAKWQHIATLKQGMYAVNVQGEVENWIKQEITDAGLMYYCRDKNQQNRQKVEQDRREKRRNRKKNRESRTNDDNEDESNEDDTATTTNGAESEPREDDGTQIDEEAENGALVNLDNSVVGAAAPSKEHEASIVPGNIPYRSGKLYLNDSSEDDNE